APTVNPAYDYEYFKGYCKIDEVDKDIIERTIDAYRELGAILTFDCTPYFENNVPRFGEICAFSASGGAVHVNSVCGARTNREAAQSALCAAITGRTPVYGMLKTENRKGDILVEVEAEIKTEFDYELLGYYTPLKMGASYHVPVFSGLSRDTSQEQLMNLGTQINIHGVVPMYHVVGVTPEANSLEDAFQGEKIPATITITKKDIQKAYDLISKGHGKVDFCILGCPHLTIQQVKNIADMLRGKKLAAQLYIFTSSLTKELAERMGLLQTIREAGGDIVKDSCVDQPCWSHLYGKSGITESPKCAYYTTRRNLSFLVRSIPECVEAALKGEI
ncbi:aconitase X catalytic domain-containing protein, partial [Synergistaceae bacterium OttesenSCG-928-I11]|nr:aconitase X catalytic domain-containing protein [Synergistaceae bacterium OttesenSCG-928-I11]